MQGRTTTPTNTSEDDTKLTAPDKAIPHAIPDFPFDEDLAHLKNAFRILAYRIDDHIKEHDQFGLYLKSFRGQIQEFLDK